MAILSHLSPCWRGQTQLRAQVLSRLQHNGASVAPPESGADALFKRALNSIIAEYLSACHMNYTLSVFQPESGLSGTVHLSHGELARVLGLKPGSLLHSALARRGMAEGGHSKGEQDVHMSCNMSLSRLVVPRQLCCLQIPASTRHDNGEIWLKLLSKNGPTCMQAHFALHCSSGSAMRAGAACFGLALLEAVAEVNSGTCSVMDLGPENEGEHLSQVCCNPAP